MSRLRGHLSASLTPSFRDEDVIVVMDRKHRFSKSPTLLNFECDGNCASVHMCSRIAAVYLFLATVYSFLATVYSLP
jgi:hypothetical protein